MAQLVEYLTLDFGSVRDLMVVGLSSKSDFMLNAEPAWDSLSPSSPPCWCASYTYIHTYIHTILISRKQLGLAFLSNLTNSAF